MNLGITSRHIGCALHDTFKKINKIEYIHIKINGCLPSITFEQIFVDIDCVTVLGTKGAVGRLPLDRCVAVELVQQDVCYRRNYRGGILEINQ